MVMVVVTRTGMRSGSFPIVSRARWVPCNDPLGTTQGLIASGGHHGEAKERCGERPGWYRGYRGYRGTEGTEVHMNTRERPRRGAGWHWEEAKKGD